MPGLAGRLQIDVGVENLLAVCAAGGSQRPTVGANNDAIANEVLTALGAYTISADDVQAIDVCIGHGQGVGHDHGVIGLSWHRHPVGRHTDDIRALHSQQPIHFREPAVIANDHRQTA
ncbi:hypothetical protein D3C78_1353870 [compost metagenome]